MKACSLKHSNKHSNSRLWQMHDCSVYTATRENKPDPIHSNNLSKLGTKLVTILICLPLFTTNPAIASAATAAAETSETTPSQNQDSNIKFSGFGTIGAVYNSSAKFDYLRDLLQNHGVGASRRLDVGVDSLLGLQISGSLSEDLEATAQTVVRRREGKFKPELTWGFIRYLPSDGLDLRAGRLGFDVYPLSDSRNVAYSYIWVRPPVEYFGGLIVSYIDGVDAAYKYDVGSGQAKIKIFAGKAQERVLTEAPNIYFSLKGSKIAGAQFEFQSQKWLARLGYSELKCNNNFPSIDHLIDTLRSPLFTQFGSNAEMLANNLSFKGKKIHYLSAGIVYDDGPLQAQLMLSRLRSETLSFNSNIAGFFTVAYRVKAWTPYLTFAKTRPADSKNIITGLPLGVHAGIDQVETGVQGFLKATRNEQSSQSIGFRYSLNQTSDLKLQIDRIHNQERLIVRAVQPDWNGRATIISASYNFIFN